MSKKDLIITTILSIPAIPFVGYFIYCLAVFIFTGNLIPTVDRLIMSLMLGVFLAIIPIAYATFHHE